MHFLIRRLTRPMLGLGLWIIAAAALAQNNTPLSYIPQANGTVRMIARSGNTVYVGGAFTMFGSQSRNRLAAFDATTGQVLAWNPNANDEVWTLFVSGSTVYVGGLFTKINGTSISRSRLAAVDTTNGTVTGWNPSISGGPLPIVIAILRSGNTVYVAGDFTKANGGAVNRNDCAAFDATTGTATAWDPNITGGPQPHVHELAISGNTIYVGGQFANVGAGSRNALAAVNDSTGALLSWNPALTGGTTLVEALNVYNGTLYVGGDFTGAGGQSRGALAAYDIAGGSLLAWNPAANAVVNQLSGAGATMYASGDFTSVAGGGTTRNRIAAFDLVNGDALPWNPGANAQTYYIVADATNVFAGGDFTMIGSQSISRMAGFDYPPSPSPTPSDTPSPTPTPSPTESLTPTPSPTPFDDATFSGSSVAPSVAPGRHILAGLVMRNAGNTTWTNAGGYTLKVVADANLIFDGVGGTVTLPDDAAVGPATPYQFSVPLVAPVTPGQYSAQFRMALGGTAFGQTGQLTLNVVQPPNAAEDWTVFE